MLSQNLTSGRAKIILTGTAIQFNKAPIVLSLNFPDLQLDISFDFDNDGSSKQRIAASAPTATNLQMTFYNFNNPIGSGSSIPVSIGTYKDEFIYLNFRVYSISEESDKSLHYTFYLSKEKL